MPYKSCKTCIIYHNSTSLFIEFLTIIKMGGQGLLLPMELKVLIMMTRLQNITVVCLLMFCGLVIIIKNFNSIGSRRPWLPILISHLFSMAFLDSWPQHFLHQGYFGWNFISFLLLLLLFRFITLLQHNMVC